MASRSDGSAIAAAMIGDLIADAAMKRQPARAHAGSGGSSSTGGGSVGGVSSGSSGRGRGTWRGGGGKGRGAGKRGGHGGAGSWRGGNSRGGRGNRGSWGRRQSNRPEWQPKGTRLHVLIEGGCTAEELKAEAEGSSKSVLDQKNAGGWTALRLAAAKARPEIVAVLLAAGANVRATSKGGMLASHGAAELREKDMGAAVQILQLLLAHDPALLELQTTAGNTPLHYAGAVSDGDATPVWELLEGCGGSATVKNSAGHTPTDKKDKEMAKAVGKMAL